jgi:hypothetical protein
MFTMFLPMAPNPVMGGHLLHVPDRRVYEVDMTVEEGVQAVVTSGVAVGAGSDRGGLPPEELAGLGVDARVGQRFDPAADPSVTRAGPAATDRADRYDERVAPENAETPGSIARRERSDDESTSPRRTPAAMADRESAARDSTGATPEAAAGREAADGEATDGRPGAAPTRDDDEGGGAA